MPQSFQGWASGYSGFCRYSTSRSVLPAKPPVHMMTTLALMVYSVWSTLLRALTPVTWLDAAS